MTDVDAAAAAAADRLERWAEIWAKEIPITAADVLALVAGFRAAVERAELHRSDSFRFFRRAVAAERRLAELQQALEEIAGSDAHSLVRDNRVGAKLTHYEWARDVARAALAGSVVEPAQDEARSPEGGETRGEEQP